MGSDEVSEWVTAAARRMVVRGSFSKMSFHYAIAKACLKAGVPHFSAGQYRHSVATWAVEAGALPEAVVPAEVLVERICGGNLGIAGEPCVVIRGGDVGVRSAEGP